MADNLTSNQNPMPNKNSPQNPPSVPASQSASPSPTKPPEPNLGELFKLFGSRRGLIIGLLLVFLVIGLLAFYAFNLKQSETEEAKNIPGQEQAPIVLASPIPGVTPQPLPPVKEDSKKKALREFFTKASPANYKEAFLAQVPEAAADSYLRFAGATDPKVKLANARGFYIILNSPGIDRSDPQFQSFMADVKAQLEKEAGGALF